MQSANRTLMGFCLLYILITVLFIAMAGCKGGNDMDPSEAAINRLQHQLAEDRATFSNMSAAIADLEATLAALESAIEAAADLNAIHSAEILGLQAQLVGVQNALTDFSVEQVAMQVQLNSMLMQMAILQGVTGIVGIEDPCGDTPGIIDEVLLRLSGGRILASFSDTASGMNTRFSIIPNGNYVVTDGSGCHFSVNDGIISY